MNHDTHYYIDAYNILFRSSSASEKLKDSREKLIEEFNSKLYLVPLNISLVFDSAYAFGESTRSHMPHLEILYTSYGETADQYIIKALSMPSIYQEVVVTSDRDLSRLARAQGAKTQSVENFLSWLNRRYVKKLLEQKRNPEPMAKVVKPISRTISDITDRLPTQRNEGSIEYYKNLFENRYKDLYHDFPLIKANQPGQKLKKTPTNFNPLEKKLSDFERWLQLFENRHHSDQ